MIQKIQNFLISKKHEKLFKFEPSKDDKNVYIIKRLENINGKCIDVDVGNLVIYPKSSYTLSAYQHFSASELDYLIKYARKLANLDGLKLQADIY